MMEIRSMSQLKANAMDDLFRENLGCVLKNIEDLETDATAKRTITLKVEILPFADRDGANVVMTGEAKLAKKRGIGVRVGLAIKHGMPIMTEEIGVQTEMGYAPEGQT